MNSQGMYVGPPYHASYQINIFSTKHLFPPVRSSLGMRIAAVWRQWNFVVDSFSFIKYICRWKQESFRVSHTPLHTYSTSPHAYSYNAHHTYNHFIHTLSFYLSPSIASTNDHIPFHSHPGPTHAHTINVHALLQISSDDRDVLPPNSDPIAETGSV